MTVIKVEALSKSYRLGSIGGGTLRADVSRWLGEVRGEGGPKPKKRQKTKNQKAESRKQRPEDKSESGKQKTEINHAEGHDKFQLSTFPISTFEESSDL